MKNKVTKLLILLFVFYAAQSIGQADKSSISEKENFYLKKVKPNNTARLNGNANLKE